MSENTRKLLSGLAEDPEMLERFKQDPRAVMNELGVSDAHQELVLKGDKKKLAEEAGVDDQTLKFVIL